MNGDDARGVGCGQVRVAVDPEAAAERKGDSAEPVRLEITFPDTYPDVAPNIVVKYSHILPKHAQARTSACLWRSVCVRRVTHAALPDLCRRSRST